MTPDEIETLIKADPDLELILKAIAAEIKNRERPGETGRDRERPGETGRGTLPPSK